MKKLLCLLLCLSVILSFCACSENKEYKITTSTEKATETTIPKSSKTEKESTKGEVTTEKAKNTTVPTSKEKSKTTEKKETYFAVDNPLNDGKIVRYMLEREDYYNFTSNPSQTFLDKKGDVIVMYSKSGKCEYPQTNKNGEWLEGISRLGVNPPMMLFKTLIDFADGSEPLNDYLDKNGIKEKSLRTAIIYSSAYPITIWLQTDKNSYLLTIDDVDDYGEYTYSFYTLKDFKEKYSPRKATLLVNGKDISKSSHVMLHYDYADLPLVATLKALGAEVTWKSETKATIKINEIKYTLDLSDCSLTYSKNGQKIDCIFAFPGGTRFTEVRSQELIIDSRTFRHALIKMGYDIKIDYQNCKIEVIKCQ